MSGRHRRGELASDADAMTVLSRALDMARRRLRYRVAAALLVAASVVVALLVIR